MTAPTAASLRKARETWPKCCDVQPPEYYFWPQPYGVQCDDANPCGQHVAIARALDQKGTEEWDAAVEAAAFLVLNGNKGCACGDGKTCQYHDDRDYLAEDIRALKRRSGKGEEG
jgi:hypothetical protein